MNLGKKPSWKLMLSSLSLNDRRDQQTEKTDHIVFLVSQSIIPKVLIFTFTIPLADAKTSCIIQQAVFRNQVYDIL